MRPRDDRARRASARTCPHQDSAYRRGPHNQRERAAERHRSRHTPLRAGGGSRGAAVACGRRAPARRPACNGRDAAWVGAGGWSRDARATRAGGSGAPVAASTAASSRSEHATGVTRGRAGVASAQSVPLARAGAAAARPLPAKYGRFIAVRACKGRDAAARVGVAGHVLARGGGRSTARVDRRVRLRDGWAVDGTEKARVRSRAAAFMPANVPLSRHECHT